MAAACCLLAAPCLRAAEAPLAAGDSTVTRSNATYALHIPTTLAQLHGPAGIFIFFGGKGDSMETCRQSLTRASESLDLALIVPQMPWFQDSAKASEANIVRGLEVLTGEIEKQFKTMPAWIIVGGYSEGATLASQLASGWSTKVPLLMLASSGPFPGTPRQKTFHVVGSSEEDLLGPDAKDAPLFGKGKKDVFVVPGGPHGPQIDYLQPWLETEVCALRLAAAGQTMQLASQALMSHDKSKGESIVYSTYIATTILGSPVPGTNSFAEYERSYRAKLLEKYAATLKSLEKLRTKIATLK